MKKLLFLPCLLAVATLAATAFPSTATSLRLPHVFGDHMVLQRDKPANVWGWAGSGEKVTVAFAGQQRTATAAADGTWRVTLDSMPASAEPRELVISTSGSGSAAQTLKYTDVLVGDIWLLGGQSNMQMPLWLRGDGFDKAKADFPLIRLMTVPLLARRAPQEDFAAGVAIARGEVCGTWFVCQPGDASSGC